VNSSKHAPESTSWPVRRLKMAARRISGGATPSRTVPDYWDGDIPWITPADVSRSDRLTSSLREITSQGLAASSAQMAPAGSIILTSRAPIGNAAMAMVPLCTSQGCKTIVPDERVILSRYFFAVVRALRDEFERLGNGTTFQEITTANVGQVRVPVPPLPQQELIARYLDNAELHIGRAIEAKQSLVELLDERRRAVSQELVTRGLDVPGAVRASGIQWLGDVPAHWEVRPAKFFYREVNERSVRGEEPLMSVSHLTGVTLRAAKNVTMFMAASYAGHKLCRKDDLVVNTMWAWMGALGVAADTGIVSPAYAVYRPLRTSPLSSGYADLLLRSRPYIDEYTCRSTGIRSSRLRLYPDRFLTVPVLCPPPDEQAEIVARVTDATVGLDTAIAAAQQDVDLLEEYRTRLIVDVVTGSQDVQQEAARLADIDQAELVAISAAATEDGGDEDIEE
jgi:type I restriction enzyme S subunit